MAVVTKYGLSIKDPNLIGLPFAGNAGGRVLAIASGAIAVANGDSINSKHYLGKLPSSAILIPSMCILHHGSITSLNDYDIGLELNGAVIDADALADGLDLTSAGTKSAVAAVPLANLGQRVWQLPNLGYTSDPAVEFDVVGLLKVASGAASNVAAFLGYSAK
jgi:hypothetical protein